MEYSHPSLVDISVEEKNQVIIKVTDDQMVGEEKEGQTNESGVALNQKLTGEIIRMYDYRVDFAMGTAEELGEEECLKRVIQYTKEDMKGNFSIIFLFQDGLIYGKVTNASIMDFLFVRGSIRDPYNV